VLARGQPGKRTVAQEVGGCGGQKVVLDEMVVELSELSGLPNALSAVAAACLPLEAPAPAACFGLGCLTFGRRLLFLLENTVLGSTRQPLSSLCIAPSAFPLCSLHVTLRASLNSSPLRLSPLHPYDHIASSPCRRPESTPNNHVSKPVQRGVGHARQSHTHRLASGAYHSASQGRSRTFRGSSHSMG